MKRNAWLAVPAVVLAAAAVLVAGMAVAGDQGRSFERLNQVRSDLVQVKGELGMYSCCIAPTCNFCALAAGMCPCGDNVDTEKGVCGECYLGWQAGQGNIAGVEPDQVRHIHGEMLQQMYMMRAEATPDATAGAHHHSHHEDHHAAAPGR